MQVLQDFEPPPTIAPRPPTIVANPHIDRSLGSKETHIQSHNHLYYARQPPTTSRRIFTIVMAQSCRQWSFADDSVLIIGRRGVRAIKRTLSVVRLSMYI